MEDVIGWRIDDVVEKIKGPKGTQVRLDVIPAAMDLDAEPTRILLTRAKIRLAERAAKSEILTLPAKDGAPARRIGVIELPAFCQDFEGRRKHSADYASATRDAARLPEPFRSEDIDGVVMDLRSHGGRPLNEPIELTALLLAPGP